MKVKWNETLYRLVAIQNRFLVQLYNIGFDYASNRYTSSKTERFYQGTHFGHFVDNHGTSILVIHHVAQTQTSPYQFHQMLDE